MASVAFKLIPPPTEDLLKLLIYEAPTALGSYVLIETVTPIGEYPEYIDNYTTNVATSATDWFAIKWEDTKGAQSALSSPIKGGTESVVDEVVDRVLQRDGALSRATVLQEAEAVVEQVFGKDPYTVDLSTDAMPYNKYRMLTGMTYLALARSYMALIASQSNTESATIGQISFKTSVGAFQNADIETLIDLANGYLGINTSIVLQMESVFSDRPNWHQIYLDWSRLPDIIRS